MLGPAAITTHLADLGAEVIKVEPPQGDYVREMTWPIVEGISLLHLHVNRGKKGIVLDLRTDEGVEVFRDLVRDADAVVEAMRPGALARRGLGYEDLKEINPKIVFCTISGYGMTGPYKDLPEPRHRLRHLGRHRAARATTTTASATSPSTPRSASTPARCSARSASSPASSGPARPARAARWRSPSPTPPPPSTGTASRPGRPTSAPRTRSPATRPTTTSAAPRAPAGMREGVRYQMYETADGHVLFMASEQAFWKNFCEGVGRPELFETWPGSKYADHARGNRELQRRAPRHLPHQDHRPSGWTSAIENNTPIAPVNTPKTIADDPQFQDRFPWLSARDPTAPTCCRSPIKVIGEELPVPTKAPETSASTPTRCCATCRLRRRPHRRAAREGRLRLSHIGDPGPLPVDPTEIQEGRAPSVLRIVGRVVLLGIAAFTLYVLLPQLLDLWDTVPRLRTLSALWFVAMVVLESGSYMSMWALTRVALPTVSWFVAGTSQLVSNAVSKTVPGGAAMGAATGWRMLSVSGVEKGSAGAALTATAIISNGVLFMLPMVALLLSIVSAPVPRGLDRVAWGGAVLFILLFAVGFALVRFDRPLIMLGNALERVSTPILRRLHRPGGPTADGLVRQRDLMVEGLGARWKKALAAAVGNWLLDYMALVAALMAVGVKPRFSVVLLAYGAAAVLGMIPITPGGLGFVEAGLTAMLVLAGVPSADALLATLAYRIVSYWLPLPAGVVAHFLFRHRYGGPPERPSPSAT